MDFEEVADYLYPQFEWYREWKLRNYTRLKAKKLWDGFLFCLKAHKHYMKKRKAE